MPNIKSAKKRVKVTETKTLQNKMYKSALKTSIKKFKSAIAAGDKALAQTTYIDAVSMVDKAVTKGILHANNAARKKSQYAVSLNSLS
ncbi:MAG: 30S ribosomal protein S20 [Eubacteriales bacterium]|nr:30S ribosomal protein S20 [Eubacteriales bacterium]